MSAGAPVILVLAGVNGAGKSSVAGARVREEDLDYFNPDEAARRIRDEIGCSIEEANSLAWHEGKRRLEEAIELHHSHAFESTLAGNTIHRLLQTASASGFDVLVWFIGLTSPEQHIARVQARVARGGHDIPEATIRQRWDASRRNLISLMPFLAELQVFDNSREGDPEKGTVPAPLLLLHLQAGRLVSPTIGRLNRTPDWAKAIIARALQIQRRASE